MGKIFSTIDNDLVLAEAQALTAAAQTSSVDLGNMELESKTAFLAIKLTTAPVGTSIQFKLQASVDNSTFVDVATSPVYTPADLKVGEEILVPIPALPNYRYVRGAVVPSSISAGVAFMGIALG